LDSFYVRRRAFQYRTSSAADCYQEALRLGGNLPFPAFREAQLGLERFLSAIGFIGYGIVG
jgi:hypothetical protein